MGPTRTNRDEHGLTQADKDLGEFEMDLIRKYGGYRNLKTFKLAQLIYDITVRFCDCYIDRRSRTHDQMVQAARSGVQNIAEGSVASSTSKKTELKLPASPGRALRSCAWTMEISCGKGDYPIGRPIIRL